MANSVGDAGLDLRLVAAKHAQILNDLLEQTPSKNVGRITVLNGLSGSDQAIVSRQSVLPGK